jgi:hypothetical protein
MERLLADYIVENKIFMRNLISMLGATETYPGEPADRNFTRIR